MLNKVPTLGVESHLSSNIIPDHLDLVSLLLSRNCIQYFFKLIPQVARLKDQSGCYLVELLYR